MTGVAPLLNIRTLGLMSDPLGGNSPQIHACCCMIVITLAAANREASLPPAYYHGRCPPSAHLLKGLSCGQQACPLGGPRMSGEKLVNGRTVSHTVTRESVSAR